MYSLFNTAGNNLLAFFRSLPTDKIRDCCTASIYRRGEDYYESDAVSQLSFNHEQTVLKAIVEGNDDYAVTIALDNGKISGSCTCPYGGVCKHIVATMLYINDDSTEFEIESVSDKDTGKLFYEYLQSLSKNELIVLVEKFASEQFRTEVKNKFSNADSAQKTFHKVEQKIRKLFDNDNLMYSPDAFGDVLDNELEKLSGLEKSLHKEIEELLFFIIQRVEEAFEDGYLYDDYGDNCYDSSYRFDAFAARYVASLTGNEKPAFLAKLDTTLKQQS
jgi:uncharacterized Zn finger protein